MPSAKTLENAVTAAQRLWNIQLKRMRAFWTAFLFELALIYRSPLSWRIGIGALATFAAVAWRLAISGMGEEKPYLTFYLAVLGASLAGGVVSGLTSLLLGVLVVHLWLARLENFQDVLMLATFLATNGLVVALGEAFHRISTRVTSLETQRTLQQLAAINTRLAEQFGSVAAAAPGLVFSFRLDAEGKGSCPYLADNARNVLGVSPQEIESDTTPVLQRIDPADRARIDEAFAQSAAQMALMHVELRYRHPVKGEIWLEMQAQPVRQSDGSLVWHGYTQDVTERKRVEAARLEAERALEQRVFELERANDRLARFAYVASHDLQEPLRKIVSFSQLLDAAVASGDQKDIAYATGVVRTSALRARELVDDLLTYSRMVDAPLKLQLRDLREEVQSALADLSEAIKEAEAEISVDVESTPFRADPPKFARLMHNLVSNAIKFHRPGERPKITIVARNEGDRVRLSIADQGVGFEAKYAKAIFEPFKRLHSKAQYPGSGIGLAICKTIADRHGWELTAESQASEGATFQIVMPTS